MNAVVLLLMVGILFMLSGMSMLYYNFKVTRRLPQRSIDDIWEEKHDYRASIYYIQKMNQISYQEAKRILVCHVLEEEKVFHCLQKHAFCVEPCIAEMKHQYVFDQYALQERVLEVHRKYQQDAICLGKVNRIDEEEMACLQAIRNEIYEAQDFIKKAKEKALSQEFYLMREEILHAKHCLTKSGKLLESLSNEELEQFITEFIVLKDLCIETLMHAYEDKNRIQEAQQNVKRLIEEIESIQ